MRKAWKTLKRPFEAVIVWLACHTSGHLVYWRQIFVDGQLHCRRCNKVVLQAPLHDTPGHGPLQP